MIKGFSTSQLGVFETTGDYVSVGFPLVEELLTLSKTCPNERARILLHSNRKDNLHEMIIALPFHSFDRPHINFKSGKSFFALKGIFAVVLFFDEGKEINPVVLSDNGKIGEQFIRLNKPIWHTIVPLNGPCVFLETIIGPFEGNQFASFSPEVNNHQDFLKFSRKVKQQVYDKVSKKYNLTLDITSL